MSGATLFTLPAVLGGAKVTLGVALSAAGAALSAGSFLQQGAAEKASARYNAALYERTAQLAEQKAQFDETRHRRLAALRMGQNRAALGDSGVTMSGSALEIFESNAAQEELDALMIKWNATNQVSDLMSNARLERAKGRNALVGGFLGAGASALLGGAKVGEKLNWAPKKGPYVYLPPVYRR
ncbi:MAG: hypothetical protein FJ271_24160 [Planctomycetes bacterium]|nr:hypothetical protein [Planctomycetota bacterium]